MKILEPQCDVLLNHCRKLRTRPFEGALRSISNWRKLRTRPFERAPRGQSTVAVWRRSDGPLVLRKTVTVTVNFLTLSQVRDSPDNSFIDFFSRSSRVALQPPPCFFSIQSIYFLILSLSLFPLRVILSLSPLSLTPPCHNTSSLRPSFSCSFSSFSSRHCQPSFQSWGCLQSVSFPNLNPTHGSHSYLVEHSQKSALHGHFTYWIEFLSESKSNTHILFVLGGKFSKVNSTWTFYILNWVSPPNLNPTMGSHSYRVPIPKNSASYSYFTIVHWVSTLNLDPTHKSHSDLATLDKRQIATKLHTQRLRSVARSEWDLWHNALQNTMLCKMTTQHKSAHD